MSRPKKTKEQPAPITPDLCSESYVIAIARSELTSLHSEVARLRTALKAANFQKHQLEKSVLKYCEILENAIAAQRRAFEELPKRKIESLVPNPITEGK